ncbi:MAG: hypothetical protein RXR31_00075 [Thermoproteota archaeon]|jgi:hypothetical protein
MDRNNLEQKPLKIKFLVRKRKLTYFFISVLGVNPELISNLDKNLIIDLINEIKSQKFNIIFFTDLTIDKGLNRSFLYALIWYKAILKKPKDLDFKFNIIKVKLDSVFGHRTKIFNPKKVKNLLINRFECLIS